MQFKHIAIVLLSSLTLAGCMHLPGSNQETPVAPEQPSTMEEGQTQETRLQDTELADTGYKLIEMMASDFKFSTNEIKAKQGDLLTVSILNSEGTHDFVIDELNVNSGMIPTGETVEINIPTDKPGTYEFYCSVNNHRQMGMTGTLIIE
jgi:plastocyanin